MIYTILYMKKLGYLHTLFKIFDNPTRHITPIDIKQCGARLLPAYIPTVR